MAQVTHLPAHPGVRPVSARIYIYGAGKNGTQKLPKRDKTGRFGNQNREGSALAWTCIGNSGGDSCLLEVKDD